MLVARSAPDLIAACARIQGAKGQNDTQKQPKIDFHAIDVTDSKTVSSWITRDALAHGAFDVLDLNVKAAFYVTREVVCAMLAANDGKGKPGSIINVSSQMGHVGGPKRSVYCATKHAIEGMTKALAW